MPPETEILVDSFVSGSFWPTLTDRIKLAAIGESRNSAWHVSGFERRAIARYCGARFLKESQKGSGYTSTSGQLEAIADNSRSTALQSSELLPDLSAIGALFGWQFFFVRLPLYRCRRECQMRFCQSSRSSMQSSMLYLTPSISLCQDWWKCP